MAIQTGRRLRAGVIGLALVLAATLHFSKPVTAAAGDPSSLPRLSLGNLSYMGAFRLPAEMSNGNSFSYGGHVVAYNPAYNSLYVSDSGYQIAEVSIPTPVVSSDVSALPFARYLQGFADPTEGHMAEISSSSVTLEGLMVYNNRLYGTAAIYYDANNTQRVSHYSRSLQLNQPSFQGWSQVWETEKSGFVSGMMSVVPAEWRPVLGGPAITGQCCLAITWRTSSGPAAFAFDPQLVGQGTVPALPLLYYDINHPTLGEWGSSNPTYGGTTAIRGMAAIAGTRTVLYFGRNGVGPFCYGDATTDASLNNTALPDGSHLCYDPYNPGKGQHAYPYNYQIWAYDLNDFAAVKSGAKQPWEVVPYDVWQLNLPIAEPSVALGGVGYDPVSQTLYIAQYKADPDGYSNRPLIHVLHVNASSAQAIAGTPATVSGVSVSSDKAAPQSPSTAITFTATPAGGVAPYQYKWLVSDGVDSIVAADWTTSNRLVWTPTVSNANYRVTAWVRSGGSTANSPEAQATVPFAINSPQSSLVSTVSLAVDRVAPQPAFTPVTWTVSATGGVAPLSYKWLLFDGANWTELTGWSTQNTFTWTPSKGNAAYQVGVWAKSAGNPNDLFEKSAQKAFAITDVVTTVSSVSLSANRTSPQTTGVPVQWTANAAGASSAVVYKWWLFDGTSWTTLTNWGASNQFTWSPNAPGTAYRLRVWAKQSANSKDEPEAAAEQPYVITAPPVPAPVVPAKVNSVKLTANVQSPMGAGNTVIFTAEPSGGVKPYQYQWRVMDGNDTVLAAGWVTGGNTFSWTPIAASPKYSVTVGVRSAGATAEEASATMPFHVNNSKK